MNAGETIEALIKIASIVKDAHQEAGKGNLKDFLASGGLADAQGTVKALVAAIDDEDIDAAIARIAKKQAALRGGKSLADLPTEKLIQHLQLGDARLALSTKRVKVSPRGDFLEWAVDDALPVLVKVAPIVLPLLL